MGGSPSGGSPNAPCEGGTQRRLRRLSLREIQLTLTDLLQTPASIFAWSAPDPKVQGFDNNADALIVAAGSFEDFADVAQLAADAADVERLAPCSDGTNEEQCAIEFFAAFANRAYGRALSGGERERLLAVYRLGRANADYARGVHLGLEAILSSPYFLYRSELGPADSPTSAGASTSLTADEAASALAFAITGARPDAELRARAASDPDFVSRAVLGEEARRLIQTPRANQQLLRFLRQWLGVDDLKAVNKIPSMFPDFTPELKADLDREMEEYLKQVLAPGAGRLSSLLTGRQGFPSELEFTKLYAADYQASGSPPVAGAFAPIQLQPTLRRGILGLPGWLAAHSPVHRSSPTDRGLAIRSRLFCQSLPSPPPGAVATAPGAGDGNATTRQKFEQHASNEKCVGCHSRMDPIGFGLEMMDAIGRYRETENGLDVDSHGALSGTDVDGPFRGPAELADKLVQSRMLRDCFTSQMFRHVMGRDADSRDVCQLSALQEFFADDQRTIAELMVEIVMQGQFTRRSFEP